MCSPTVPKENSQNAISQQCSIPAAGVKLLISRPISRLHVVTQGACLQAQTKLKMPLNNQVCNDGISYPGFTTGDAEIERLYEVSFILHPQQRCVDCNITGTQKTNAALAAMSPQVELL